MPVSANGLGISLGFTRFLKNKINNKNGPASLLGYILAIWYIFVFFVYLCVEFSLHKVLCVFLFFEYLTFLSVNTS